MPKKSNNFLEDGEILTRQGAAGRARQAQREDYEEALTLAKRGDLLGIRSDLLVRHYQSFRRIAAECRRAEQKEAWAAEAAKLFEPLNPRALVFRPWQVELMAILQRAPDDRTIVWVEDPNGNAGKTTFARWYHATHLETSDIIIPAREADMAYAIRPGLRVYLLDVPRSKSEFVVWGFLENLKNGVFTSAKYESTTCYMQSPHVVIFANIPVPEVSQSSGFSRDRIKHIKC